MKSASPNFLRTGGSNGSMSSVSMIDLPNLPGVRRDVSALNPKLYKEFKAATSGRGTLIEANFPPMNTEEESLDSFFESSSRIAELGKSLSMFPPQSASYSDLSGRYSLKSQQQDRNNKRHLLMTANSTGSLKTTFMNSNRKVCTFVAFFTENSDIRTSEINSRKVHIKFFLDDETIEIIEPKLENGGTPSGKFLRRHKVYKPDGSTYYKLEDFQAGANLVMYSRTYTILDCDNFTKKYFDDTFLSFGYPKPLPNTLYDPKTRPGLTQKATKSLKSAIEKEKLKSKSLGFFQYDRKVLRFYGVWDCRSLLFGDDLKVKIHYTLADGSMEIVPVHERNSGRDNLPKFLKRTQIQKGREDFFETTAPSIDEYSLAGYSSTGLISSGSMLSLLGEGPGVDPPPTYHWTDLCIGMVIPVASLTVQLVDADEFTREFYNSKEMPLDPPIKMPEPVYPEVTNGPIQSLIPKEIKSAAEKEKMNLYQGMLLRYKAEMNDPKEADKTREFVIQYYLENDTVQIMEPPLRNTGHKGGVFLTRCKLPVPIEAKDLYLGASVSILSHKFNILDADLYTLKFMESHTEIWEQCNHPLIMKRVKQKKEAIKKVLLLSPGLSSEFLDLNSMQAIFDKANCILLKQEVCTIFRQIDLARSGSVKMSKLLRYIIDA